MREVRLSQLMLWSAERKGAGQIAPTCQFLHGFCHILYVLLLSEEH